LSERAGAGAATEVAETPHIIVKDTTETTERHALCDRTTPRSLAIGAIIS